MHDDPGSVLDLGYPVGGEGSLTAAIDAIDAVDCHEPTAVGVVIPVP
ncbi:hypothetical protein [Arthrobacter sp. A5]